MYIIYVDFLLRKNIIIEKLGIKFRKLSKKEKQLLLENVNTILSYKEDILHVYNKYKNFPKNSNVFLADIIQYNDPTKQSIVMTGYEMLRAGFCFNNAEYIKNIINYLLVIEIDNNILEKYIEKDSITKFISNFLSVGNIYDETLNSSKMRYNNDYTFILNDNILNDKSDKFYQDIMLHLVLSYKNPETENSNFVLKKVQISSKYLKTLEKFIYKVDNDNLIKFIEIIDILYSNPNMIQNAILNNVLIVESLLVKESSNLQRDYVLKGGMILKKYINGGMKSSNKAIKELLTFVYNIRSDIIHGNIKKIEDDLNSLNQKNSDIKKLVGKVDKYQDKKTKAYDIAFTISMFVVRCVIKHWLDYTSDIDFLKNN